MLLSIFDSCRREFSCSRGSVTYGGWGTWSWHKFIHVCRRWRHVIFAYPGYLDLRLICKSKTHVQAALDTWPALPLSIRPYFGVENAGENDIIGALEHRDLIAGIHLRGFNRSQLKKCITLMQEPFPALTSLELDADGQMFDLTDAFLGGSTPLLQKISLSAGIIQFPNLPRFLSSASGLVDLTLRGIPTTGEGYMSPDAIAICLSVMTKLRSLARGNSGHRRIQQTNIHIHQHVLSSQLSTTCHCEVLIMVDTWRIFCAEFLPLCSTTAT